MSFKSITRIGDLETSHDGCPESRLVEGDHRKLFSVSQSAASATTTRPTVLRRKMNTGTTLKRASMPSLHGVFPLRLLAVWFPRMATGKIRTS